MSVPVTTPSLAMSDFFSTSLSSSINGTTDTVIPLNAVPTGSEGFLVIDGDNSSREIIYYNSKGGSSVTCPTFASGRGQGGTTGVSHSSGATVKLNVVSQYWSELQNGNALKAGAVSNAALAANVAWTTWTPTWANLTIGNATVTARYQQIGKTLRGFIRVTLGSTSSVGSGPTFTLPVTANAVYNTPLNHIGFGYAEDSGVAGYNITAYIDSSTTVGSLHVANAAGTYLNNTAGIGSTVPFTWGTGDYFNFHFEYEAA